MRHQTKHLLVSVGLLLSAVPAQAVDQTEIRIEGRWSVVGVISGEPQGAGKVTGIAVLRSNITKKTYTLSVGDSVPNEFGFTLKAVKPHSVEIASAGSAAVTLNFADTAVSDAPAAAETEQAVEGAGQNGRASRFLESYYRGFNQARTEHLRGSLDEDDEDDQTAGHGGAVDLDSARPVQDGAITASGQFRSKTYRMDEDDNGFTVNFDDDEGQTTRSGE